MDSKRLLIDRISTHLAITSEKLTLENSVNKLDLNIFLENVYIDLFNEIYKTNFKNTNTENSSYPVIDAIDEGERVGIQITSNISNTKIENTLKSFIKNGLDEKCDKIYFIFLKKKKKFSKAFKSKINKIIGDKLIFNLDTDIYDNTDFFSALYNEDYETIRRVNQILDKSIGLTPLNKTIGLNAVSISFHDEELENASLLVSEILQEGINVFTSSISLYNRFEEQKLKHFEYLVLVQKNQKIPSVRYTLLLLSNEHIRRLYSNKKSEICDIYQQAILGDNRIKVVAFEKYLNTIDIQQKSFRCYLSLERGNLSFRTKEILNDLISDPGQVFYSQAQILEEVKRIFPNFEFRNEYIESDFHLFHFCMIDQESIKLNFLVFNLNYSFTSLIEDFRNDYIEDFNENLQILIPKSKGHKTRKSIERVKVSFPGTNVNFIDEYLFDKNFKRIEKANLLDIDNYVSPVILDESGTARISDIVHWIIDNDSSTVAVIQAPGGVGKTTVCKKIHDTLINDFERYIVIFINADTYIEKFKDRHFIDDSGYDLYTIYSECVGLQDRIDQNSFNLNYSMGNIIVIFDGVDEIISTIPLFDIDKFLKKLDDFHQIIGKGKIILNCRDTYIQDLKDYYLLEESPYSSTVVFFELLSFSYDLAQEYFEQMFEGDKLKLCLNLLNDFQIHTKLTEYVFPPFVLEIIVQIVESDFEYESITNHFGTHLLMNNIDLDIITYNVCDREILKKKENGFPLAVDDQVNFLIHLAVQEKGIISQNGFVNVLSKIGISNRPEDISKGLFDHPFLLKSNGDFKFRFDFLQAHFKAIFIFNVIIGKTIIARDERTIELFSEDLSYDSYIFKSILERIRKSDSDLDFYIKSIRKILEEFQLFEHPNAKIIHQAVSNLALMVIGYGKDIVERTEIFIKLFKDDGFVLRNFSLVDVPDKIDLKLDFRSLWFTETYIDNYKNLFNCTFSEDTYFDEHCMIYQVYNPEIDFNKITAKSGNFHRKVKGDNSAYRLLNFIEKGGGDTSNYFREFLSLFKSKNRIEGTISRTKMHNMKGVKFELVKAILEVLVRQGIIVEATRFEIEIAPVYKSKITKYVTQGLSFAELNRARKDLEVNLHKLI